MNITSDTGMKKRGLTCEIPNERGRFLGDLLQPFDTAAYDWYNGGEEAYFCNEEIITDPLFPNQLFDMDGVVLKDIVENNEYYIIFADLKAFPKGTKVVNVQTYEEYVKSDCQFVLIIVDCVYAAVYCKDQDKLAELYLNAQSQGYSNVQYTTDENDFRTRLSAW
ncbi:DUF2691 family protein [Paenibacillus sp. FSL R7-0273]|uniref:DUF2691 family protein n=1 Tax=Paenibacillus sp. FSL R7-0273 TaxID=1536772 RepID=UPI000AADCED5|nr:DUF2691 family protein [Paenibacillus sp. FSL R7-0273]